MNILHINVIQKAMFLAILKQIRFLDQFSIRKCLLRPKERFQVHVNGKVDNILENLLRFLWLVLIAFLTDFQELPIPTSFRHELIDEEQYRNPKVGKG